MIELSRDTEVLARQLAAAQGVSVEEAIRQAVEQSAREAGVAPRPQSRRDGSVQAVAARKARIDQAADEIAAMPVLDSRPPREIIDDLNAP